MNPAALAETLVKRHLVGPLGTLDDPDCDSTLVEAAATVMRLAESDDE